MHTYIYGLILFCTFLPLCVGALWLMPAWVRRNVRSFLFFLLITHLHIQCMCTCFFYQAGESTLSMYWQTYICTSTAPYWQSFHPCSGGLLVERWGPDGGHAV